MKFELVEIKNKKEHTIGVFSDLKDALACADIKKCNAEIRNEQFFFRIKTLSVFDFTRPNSVH